MIYWRLLKESLGRKEKKLLEKFMISLLLVMTLSTEAGGTEEFFALSEGRSFFREFCSSHGYNSINFFLGSNGDSNNGLSGWPQLLSVFMRDDISFSVRRIGGGDGEISQTLRKTTSHTLNVAFLQQPQDLELFTKMADPSPLRMYPWLLLGNIQELIAKIQNPYLILDNQMMFASMDISTKAVTIFEVYSIKRNLPPRIQKLGYWQEGLKLSITKKSWNERRSNLTGLHLRCVTMEQPPFVYLSDPDDWLNVDLRDGYGTAIWHTLRDRLGFTYSCQLPPDRLWGNPNNGVWNGLVRELLENSADVVVTSLDHTSARAEVVDFPLGFKEIGYQLVVRRPGLMERTWTSFTSEMMPASWISILAFLVFVPPVLSFCARFSPLQKEKINIKDAYILAIGAFTTQGSWLELTSVSTRIVFITIFLTTLLIYAHYTSALVSLLTIASTVSDIASIQSLLEEGTHSIGFMRDTSLQNVFQTAKSGLFYEVWENLVFGDPQNLPPKDEIGIKWVKHSSYVHLIEENLYRSTFATDCQTMLVPGKYFSQQTGFAFQKGSPLRKIFETQMIRLLDTGITSRLWDVWKPTPPLCTTESVVALNINQLFTAFLLLLVGLATAVIFLPCERLHWNFIGKRSAKGENEKPHQHRMLSSSEISSSLFSSHNFQVNDNDFHTGSRRTKAAKTDFGISNYISSEPSWW